MGAVYENRSADRGKLLSVARSARLLKTFYEQQAEIGITDLAKRLGVAKSTVHRMAASLISEGLLEQNPANGKYRLGIALFRLGSLVRSRMLVSSKAQPLLRNLREKFNETVDLVVLDGSEIMYVQNMESSHTVRMRSDIGARKPAYCTAEGRAILAFQTADVVERILRDGLTPRTPQTVTDPEMLQKILDRVRVHGCAIDDEECDAGFRCIAAPLHNGAGEVVAAIGLGGPVARFSKHAVDAFVPHVVETAAAISMRLGHRPVHASQAQ
jgi:IclR family transcriptional regulator, KDG regulon repressor